jgi:hypothetical protein
MGHAVKHIVRFGQLVTRIADHQVLELPQFLMRITPAFVAVYAVCAACQHDCFAILEFTQSLVKCHDFSRADECEVQWIKIKANPFSLEIGQFQILKLLVGPVFCTIVCLQSQVESRSRLSYANTH